MFKTLISSAACILGLLCSSASAQETSNRVSIQTDWSVFVESDPKECWAVTVPKKSEYSRGGIVVPNKKIKRGNPLLFVFHRPSQNVNGQVALAGGYTFANGLLIELDLDSVKYELVADGDWAWPPSPADDAKIIAAMKRGAKAVVTAKSERGTKIKDTFSLKGFTAAIKDAEKSCAD